MRPVRDGRTLRKLNTKEGNCWKNAKEELIIGIL
jgi:hypothetical protein